jgi:hypothetical protein
MAFRAIIRLMSITERRSILLLLSQGKFYETPAKLLHGSVSPSVLLH